MDPHDTFREADDVAAPFVFAYIFGVVGVIAAALWLVYFVRR